MQCCLPASLDRSDSPNPASPQDHNNIRKEGTVPHHNDAKLHDGHSTSSVDGPNNDGKEQQQQDDPMSDTESIQFDTVDNESIAFVHEDDARSVATSNRSISMRSRGPSTAAVPPGRVSPATTGGSSSQQGKAPPAKGSFKVSVRPLSNAAAAPSPPPAAPAPVTPPPTAMASAAASPSRAQQDTPSDDGSVQFFEDNHSIASSAVPGQWFLQGSGGGAAAEAGAASNANPSPSSSTAAQQVQQNFLRNVKNYVSEDDENSGDDEEDGTTSIQFVEDDELGSTRRSAASKAVSFAGGSSNNEDRVGGGGGGGGAASSAGEKKTIVSNTVRQRGGSLIKKVGSVRSRPLGPSGSGAGQPSMGQQPTATSKPAPSGGATAVASARRDQVASNPSSTPAQQHQNPAVVAAVAQEAAFPVYKATPPTATAAQASPPTLPRSNSNVTATAVAAAAATPSTAHSRSDSTQLVLDHLREQEYTNVFAQHMAAQLQRSQQQAAQRQQQQQYRQLYEDQPPSPNEDAAVNPPPSLLQAMVKQTNNNNKAPAALDSQRGRSSSSERLPQRAPSTSNTKKNKDTNHPHNNKELRSGPRQYSTSPSPHPHPSSAGSNAATGVGQQQHLYAAADRVGELLAGAKELTNEIHRFNEAQARELSTLNARVASTKLQHEHSTAQYLDAQQRGYPQQQQAKQQHSRQQPSSAEGSWNGVVPPHHAELASAAFPLPHRTASATRVVVTDGPTSAPRPQSGGPTSLRNAAVELQRIVSIHGDRTEADKLFPPGYWDLHEERQRSMTQEQIKRDNDAYRMASKKTAATDEQQRASNSTARGKGKPSESSPAMMLTSSEGVFKQVAQAAGICWPPLISKKKNGGDDDAKLFFTTGVRLTDSQIHQFLQAVEAAKETSTSCNERGGAGASHPLTTGKTVSFPIPQQPRLATKNGQGTTLPSSRGGEGTAKSPTTTLHRKKVPRTTILRQVFDLIRDSCALFSVITESGSNHRAENVQYVPRRVNSDLMASVPLSSATVISRSGLHGAMRALKEERDAMERWLHHTKNHLHHGRGANPADVSLIATAACQRNQGRKAFVPNTLVNVLNPFTIYGCGVDENEEDHDQEEHREVPHAGTRWVTTSAARYVALCGFALEVVCPLLLESCFDSIEFAQLAIVIQGAQRNDETWRAKSEDYFQALS